MPQRISKRELFKLVGAGAAALSRPGGAAQAPEQRAEIETAELRPMEARVLYYRSRVYGELQPMVLCATDLSTEPKPLLVYFGIIREFTEPADGCRRICELARASGMSCVVLRPSGRGGVGSVHQGYGEVDVFEAIDAVRRRIAIDPDRISVTGSSVGGAAVWYHASHYPDYWAAAVPQFGYCDHKLWEKPGGSTFPLQPWEDFSWTGRSAAYRVGNLGHVPLRIIHGEWDRAVAGGVPVEHSRQMARKLGEIGARFEYFEVPKIGHDYAPLDLWMRTMTWMIAQRRAADPERVSLTVHTLRHHRSHWVALEQQLASGKASRVIAHSDRTRSVVEVETENARLVALGPIPGVRRARVVLDRTAIDGVDLTSAARFLRAGSGAWSRTDSGPGDGEKRPGLSGPFGDLFHEPTVAVFGTSGSEAESHFNRGAAANVVRFFNRWNGGVHRGGIPGDITVPIPICSDAEALALADGRPAPPPPAEREVAVTRDLLERSNLLFIGSFKSNAALARLAGRIPVAFGPRTLELGGKTFDGEHVAATAVFPHPDRRRYVALLAGVEPDAICWGSHLNLQLLPDYFVFDRARVVEWGFWNKQWRHPDRRRDARR